MNIIDILLLIGSGALLTLFGVLMGAFVMFKGKNAVPGEGFIGGVPKGQVFNIPVPEETDEMPEAETNILKKTEMFLKSFGGKS